MSNELLWKTSCLLKYLHLQSWGVMGVFLEGVFRGSFSELLEVNDKVWSELLVEVGGTDCVKKCPGTFSRILCRRTLELQS